MHPRPSGVVALLTDFGAKDPYVGVMHGVVLRHYRKATVVDLGHDVPAHDVEAGAFWLLAAVARFPSGSVHAAIVDPGVGSARRLLAVRAHDGYWLAPDNGLLTHVLGGDARAEVRAIDPAALGLRDVSRTFHGRDVFAPVAAWLAGGRYGFDALGPRVEDMARLAPIDDGPYRVVYVDGFGNLITNVPAHEASRCEAVGIGGTEVPVTNCYADVAPGAPLALIGSYGLLEVAVNQGSAARVLGLGRGAEVELRAASNGKDAPE